MLHISYYVYSKNFLLNRQDFTQLQERSLIGSTSTDFMFLKCFTLGLGLSLPFILMFFISWNFLLASRVCTSACNVLLLLSTTLIVHSFIYDLTLIPTYSSSNTLHMPIFLSFFISPLYPLSHFFKYLPLKETFCDYPIPFFFYLLMYSPLQPSIMPGSQGT